MLRHLSDEKFEFRVFTQGSQVSLQVASKQPDSHSVSPVGAFVPVVQGSTRVLQSVLLHADWLGIKQQVPPGTRQSVRAA